MDYVVRVDYCFVMSGIDKIIMGVRKVFFGFCLELNQISQTDSTQDLKQEVDINGFFQKTF